MTVLEFEPRATGRRTVRSGEASLAVFEHGDPANETVVLVHGWPDTHHVWDAVVPLLADRFHVVTYDTRGHGESPLPGSAGKFGLPQLADDLYAVAAAVSPDRPVHLVGHDWGSIQTWEAVCRAGAGERFAGFTSISGPCLDHAGYWLRGLVTRPTPRHLATLSRQALSSTYIYLFLTPRLPELVLRRAGAKGWPLFLRATEGLEGVEAPETLVDDMVAGVRLYRANMLDRVFRPRERRTTVPVQLVVNTRDVAMTPAMFAGLGEWVEDLTRVDLESGHWLPLADPQLVADLVTEFAERAERGEPGR